MTGRRGRAAAAAAATALTFAAGPACAQTFSGSAEAKGSGYLSRGSERDPWFSGWGTLLVKAEGRVGKARWAVVARAEAITDGSRGEPTFDPADRELRRSPLSLREAWIGLPLGPSVDLELGRFSLGWGKTDGYSPADAFLPRDLSDPYADEKLPVWGARVRAQTGPLRAEAIGTLTTTPWRLPVLSGRFAPVDTSDLALPLYLVDGEQDAPRTGFGALRLLATFGDWDVGLWGRFGVRPAPLLVPRIDLAEVRDDGIALPADRRFVREDGVGAELSRVVGGFVVRAELAALFSADPALGDALIWTLGAERGLGDGTLLVTLAANARAEPSDVRVLFDRAILPSLVAAWTRSEEWGSWKLVWAQGLSHGDGLLRAEVANDLTDRWRLAAGVDYPYGSRRGPYGARPDTKRLWASVRRSW